MRFHKALKLWKRGAGLLGAMGFLGSPVSRPPFLYHLLLPIFMIKPLLSCLPFCLSWLHAASQLEDEYSAFHVLTLARNQRETWFLAARTFDLHRLQALLEDNEDLLDIHEDIGQPSRDPHFLRLKGYNALQCAVAMAERADADAAAADAVVQWLIDHGANINSRGAHPSSRSVTALCLAAGSHKPSLVKKLLDTGRVELNSRGPGGQTPLMVVAQEQDPEVACRIVGMLMEAGADPDLADEDGQTALMLAAQINALDTVEKLLSSRADGWLEDPSGRLFLNHCPIRKCTQEDIARWEALREQVIQGRVSSQASERDGLIEKMILGSLVDEETFRSLAGEELAMHLEKSCLSRTFFPESGQVLRGCCDEVTGELLLDLVDQGLGMKRAPRTFLRPLFFSGMKVINQIEGYVATIAPVRAEQQSPCAPGFLGEKKLSRGLV